MNAFKHTRLAPGAPAAHKPTSALATPAPRTAADSQKAQGKQHALTSGARSGQKRPRESDDEGEEAAPPAQRTAQAKRDALFQLDTDEEDEDDQDEGDESHGHSSAEEAAPSRSRGSGSSRPGRPAQSTAAASTAAASSSTAHSSASPAGPARKKPRNAPEELSIPKRPVKSGVIVTALPKFNVEKKRRDPRFDPMCGDYSTQHFSNNYSFLNEAKSAEISEWQAELRKGSRDGRALTADEKADLQSQIQRAKQQLAAQSREKNESSLLAEWKRGERAAQKEGKKPFFLKKSEQKKLSLAARYLALKEKKGALQKFMVKKTKDIKNKDHTYMPRQQG